MESTIENWTKPLIFICWLVIAVMLVWGAYQVIADPTYISAQTKTDDGFFKYDISGFVMGTGSMMPCITPQSKLYYQENFALKVGEIYVYENNLTGQTIAHRLMYKDGGWCYFKGDNNLYLDPKVNCSNVIFRVVAIDYDYTR